MDSITKIKEFDPAGYRKIETMSKTEYLPNCTFYTMIRDESTRQGIIVVKKEKDIDYFKIESDNINKSMNIFLSRYNLFVIDDIFGLMSVLPDYSEKEMDEYMSSLSSDC